MITTCSARAPSPRWPTTPSTCSARSTRPTSSPRSAWSSSLSPCSTRPAAASSTSPRTRPSSPTKGWGGYGSSKAALEQVTNILAAEHPRLRVYRVDPGDMNTQMHRFDFRIGPDLEAHEPPEARGLRRDEVRLLVSHHRDDTLVHTAFRDLPRFLEPGDLVVVNTSATIPAAVPARRADGERLELRLSTRLPAGLWTVELRWPSSEGSAAGPFGAGVAGETLSLPEGGHVTLLTPHAEVDSGVRLWVATLEVAPGWSTRPERRGVA